MYKNLKSNWIVIGKGKISKKMLEAIAKAKHYCKIIGCNDVYKHLPFKVDYIISVDFPSDMLDNHTDERLILTNLTNTKLKVLNGKAYYEYEKSIFPDFDRKTNRLCACPYTGLAALNFVYKQKPKKVFIVGFSSNKKHNYFYGDTKLIRNDEQNNKYIENFNKLVKKMNCFIDKKDKNFNIETFNQKDLLK